MSMRRRDYLVASGTVGATLLAGCSGSGDGESDGSSGNEYEEGGSGNESNASDSGSENDSDSNSDSENDSESNDSESDSGSEDQPDQEEVENRDEGEDVLEFGDLAIIEHEEQIEEREYGDDQMSVVGVVENRDDAKYDSVFVGVRVYNADGHQLDQYLDSTSDLQGGGTWQFEVSILENADEIESWDIGVWGSQY